MLISYGIFYLLCEKKSHIYIKRNFRSERLVFDIINRKFHNLLTIRFPLNQVMENSLKAVREKFVVVRKLNFTGGILDFTLNFRFLTFNFL